LSDPHVNKIVTKTYQRLYFFQKIL